jgi:hypothetical protein
MRGYGTGLAQIMFVGTANAMVVIGGANSGVRRLQSRNENGMAMRGRNEINSGERTAH